MAATFVPDTQRLLYHPHLAWLPDTYDSTSTWRAFWIDLGIACSFWAARDWLLGTTRTERQASRTGVLESGGLRFYVPARLRRLVWVASVNGALVGLEAIVQRFETNKLLWLVRPRWNRDAISQFGPYAYRSNAAQYFNLLWPATLALWFDLRRLANSFEEEVKALVTRHYMLLLPCALFMAACPIISASRGAVAIDVFLMLGTAVLLLGKHSGGEHRWFKPGFVLFFLTALSLAAYVSGAVLEQRFSRVFKDRMSGRLTIYHSVRPLVHQYPLWGTGPGTFWVDYALYRKPGSDWEVFCHDDWLETRIAYGWVGFSLILASGLLVVLISLCAGGIRLTTTAWSLVGLGLVGCLGHARFDFPFQIWSVRFLFVLLCCVLVAGTGCAPNRCWRWLRG